jgi:hypothetical protein
VWLFWWLLVLRFPAPRCIQQQQANRKLADSATCCSRVRFRARTRDGFLIRGLQVQFLPRLPTTIPVENFKGSLLFSEKPLVTPSASARREPQARCGSLEYPLDKNGLHPYDSVAKGQGEGEMKVCQGCKREVLPAEENAVNDWEERLYADRLRSSEGRCFVCGRELTDADAAAAVRKVLNLKLKRSYSGL